MDSPGDEDDLKLVKASADLLADLEEALPKLLWKPPRTGQRYGDVHRQVKRRDLEFVIQKIEPFQGEPQLLDGRLKYILPPVVEAYIRFLQLAPQSNQKGHLDFQSAICVILYTLCKVRGYKIIVGFLNNEPRYLEPILEKLEDVLVAKSGDASEWQVPYVLLLWLSHLLLTPFDLASISDRRVSIDGMNRLDIDQNLPPIAVRILRVGLSFLPVSTKTQDAAAMLLVRLVTRPDMQKLQVADAIVTKCLLSIQDETSDVPVTIYQRLGPMRVLSGVAISAELSYLIPSIYQTCRSISENDESPMSSNAVAKKLIIKTLRNIAILSLRSSTLEGPLLSFLETTDVLEDVIDYLLRSLGDRDTPVRYAAAKALSQVILELDSAMGHEIIQAILDAFTEDMPRNSDILDFRTVNALKWHGLTLALAHTLFKRSASPEQLPDILNALTSALQFEQRTATGSNVGTNVRDAANFGIWSLSRRYTTNELLSVDFKTTNRYFAVSKSNSVLQELAIQLILSACLDPVGNIRRGSSAAFQELVGRHPNQVHEGISLVQVVDYQTVGLRRRAMVDVAYQAALMERSYWSALADGLFGWRGLGSPDVLSREAAASALAKLGMVESGSCCLILSKIKQHSDKPSQNANDVEDLHGLVLSFANLLDELNMKVGLAIINGEIKRLVNATFQAVIIIVQESLKTFSPRIIRSELASAVARLLGAAIRTQLAFEVEVVPSSQSAFETIDGITDQLLGRHEETIQQTVPQLVQSLVVLKRKLGAPLGCIGAQNLSRKVAVEGSKSTLNGACRAIALGALVPLYQEDLSGEKVMTHISTLADLTLAMNVDWRIIGVKALQLAVQAFKPSTSVGKDIAEKMTGAVHDGLNDYTIDERGDIGSLVRLQAIACTSTILSIQSLREDVEGLQNLASDIYRLSLEKLDRVRLEAAKCRHQYLHLQTPCTDVASVSSYQYFSECLQPLVSNKQTLYQRALLEGCISCAGIGAESLLQTSRAVLVDLLNGATLDQLEDVMSMFTVVLKTQLTEGGNTHPTRELLAFLLHVQIPQRLTETGFKWRNLLSVVQKSHHRSNDIPKITSAVRVYRGLADIPAIRDEVLKKLISMLRTNPYPRVRSSVAETFFVITREVVLKDRDWSRPVSQYLDIVEQLRVRYVKG